MPSLNQYANRIASIVNQENNHILKERVKDMIKNMFASRIRQSTEKHGVDHILNLTFIMPVIEYSTDKLYNYPNGLFRNNNVFGTENKIPVPIRVYSDTPFTYVGDTNGNSFKYLATPLELKYQRVSSPTVVRTSYTYTNGIILIYRPEVIESYCDRNPIEEVMLTAIWENPEEVIGMYGDKDADNYELPFPNDMLESIILEILKTEFGIMPVDLSIPMNTKPPVKNG